MKKKNGILKHFDFLLLDLVCLISSFIFAYYLRHNNFNLFSIDIYKDMFFVIIAIELLIFFFLDPFKYIVRRGNYTELQETIKYDLISFLASVIYLFLVKEASNYSRLTLVYTYILYFISSYIVRVLWKRHIYHKSLESITNGSKSLLIVCNKKDAKKTLEDICNNNYEFYHINGLYIVDENLYGKTINGYKVVANSRNILEYVSTNWVDDIFIACNYNKMPKRIIDGFVSTGITLHIKLDDISIFNGRPQTIDKLGTFNTITSVNREYKQIDLVIKRVFDIVGGIIGCLLTILLIIIVGPIIYIKSPGNIFYVSDRVGKNGKVFKFYKFRSMILNADDYKQDLKKQNRLKDGMMFKVDNDPRIIPGIGEFIRKTSIDEFPQFFNVLKGDMSLVGTRPPTLDEWNKYSPYYRSRLSIKPGITGLWQVSGRSNITDFDEVVKLDNEYIINWSLSLDVKILLKTIIMIFTGEHNGAM